MRSGPEMYTSGVYYCVRIISPADAPVNRAKKSCIGDSMLRTIRNVDYVILLCDDVEMMKHFYHEVMEFPIQREWPGWIEMSVGSVRLTLRERGRPYDGPKTTGSAGVQLAFRVAPSEVETCYQELVQKGVAILQEPRDFDYGHRTLFFNDPEGNILEIYADIDTKSTEQEEQP
jgi:lactoylglutathione lyase